MVTIWFIFIIAMLSDFAGKNNRSEIIDNNSSPDNMKKFLLLLLAVIACMAKQSFAQDQRVVDSLQTLLKTVKQDTSKANVLYELSKVYWHNYSDKAMDYAKQTLVLSEKIGFKKGLGNAFNSMGQVYLNKGDYLSALAYFKKSLKIMEVIGDKKGIAGSYNNIGIVYDNLGNYPDALQYYFAALKLREEIGDKKGIASSYNNIGGVYFDHGNYPAALKNYFASLKIHDELGYTLGIVTNYNNIGLVYSAQGNYPEALKIHFVSLKMKEEIRDKAGIALSYHNIGIIYRKQGNYPAALKNLFAALKIYEELGDKWGIALSQSNIGAVYTRQKKYYEASKYLNNSLSLSKEIGSLMRIQYCYTWLARLDSIQGNFKQALEQYKMSVITRDSMFNMEKTKKIMQMEVDKKIELANAEQEKKDALAQKELQRQKLVRNGFIGGFAIVLVFAVVFLWQRKKISKEKQISEDERKKSDAEKNRSEELLLNILPAEVAEELKSTGAAKAKTFSLVSVMFTDFKDFTSVSEKVSAELLVDEIHHCFSAFDAILQKYKIEKIKTIGDAYMCASGLPVLNYTHAEDIVNAAFEIRDFMAARKKEKESRREIPFELRIGIHTGPVVAGIVGVKKFQYDIWGDTVNLAARMESSGEAGKVNISGSTYRLVKDQFACTYRGKIQAKHKGEIDMYFVEAV